MLDLISMRSHDKFIALDLVFRGRWPDLDAFSREFGDVKWASTHLRRLGPPHIQYYGGPPAELVVLVFSLATNIATIADILAKRLGKRRDSTVRIGKKEMRLRGPWKAKEIVRVMAATSTPTGKQEALKRMRQIKSRRIAETRAKLVDLEGAIRDYENLVRGFNGIRKKQAWQKRRAKDYKTRLAELKKEHDQLVSFIGFLEQD